VGAGGGADVWDCQRGWVLWGGRAKGKKGRAGKRKGRQGALGGGVGFTGRRGDAAVVLSSSIHPSHLCPVTTHVPMAFFLSLASGGVCTA